jgi:hypothetical protein
MRSWRSMRPRPRHGWRSRTPVDPRYSMRLRACRAEGWSVRRVARRLGLASGHEHQPRDCVAGLGSRREAIRHSGPGADRAVVRDRQHEAPLRARLRHGLVPLLHLALGEHAQRAALIVLHQQVRGVVIDSELWQRAHPGRVMRTSSASIRPASPSSRTVNESVTSNPPSRKGRASPLPSWKVMTLCKPAACASAWASCSR